MFATPIIAIHLFSVFKCNKDYLLGFAVVATAENKKES